MLLLECLVHSKLRILDAAVVHSTLMRCCCGLLLLLGATAWVCVEKIMKGRLMVTVFTFYLSGGSSKQGSNMTGFAF